MSNYIRNKLIMEFLETVKVCDITHIAKLFYANCKFPEQKARAKMKDLYQRGFVSRKRTCINSKYYYWLKGSREPLQVLHKLLLTELYVNLCLRYGRGNMEIFPEYSNIDGIRPDAFIKLQYNRRLYFLFVEVHLSNNAFDTDKYEKVFKSGAYRSVFPANIFPDIIIITDKRISINSQRLTYKIIDTSFENIETLIS